LAYWLLKVGPNDYSYEHLERDGKAVWDGGKINLALRKLLSIRKGDSVFIYHRGKREKE